MKKINREDHLRLKGYLRIIVGEGKNQRVYEYNNLIVDAGANLIRDFLKGDSVSGLTHLALGTGTTSPSTNDVGLENETYRKAFTDVAVENRLLRIAVFFTSSEYAGDISELGLFGNGATDTLGTGTMYSRTTIATITKSNTEPLTVEWTLTF